MNFRRLPLLFALAFVALALPARAQFVGQRLGLYGTMTAQQVTTSSNSGNTVSAVIGSQPLTGTSNGSTNIEPIGGFGGVYYDFMDFGAIRLGADLRAGTTHTKQGAQSGFNNVGTRVNMVLGGVRAGIRTPISWLKPYVQGSAGWGASNFGTGTAASLNGLTVQTNRLYNGLAYSGFAGVDIKLFPVMDVRIPEVGLGSIHANGSSHTVKSISAGVVFHLP